MYQNLPALAWDYHDAVPDKILRKDHARPSRLASVESWGLKLEVWYLGGLIGKVGLVLVSQKSA